MSSPRIFSIVRHKVGLIDLVTQIRPTCDGIIIKSATNWDATFTPLSGLPAVIPIYGYVDPLLAGMAHQPLSGEITRAIFRPSTSGLSDTGPLWLKLAFTHGGVEQTSGTDGPSAPTLVLSPGDLPTTMQAIAGTVPSAASLAASQQIDFPRLVQDVHLTNTGATDLLVAFNAEGPEVTVKAGATMGGLYGTASSLFVRTLTGTTTITVNFAYAFPR